MLEHYLLCFNIRVKWWIYVFTFVVKLLYYWQVVYMSLNLTPVLKLPFFCVMFY